MVKGNKAQMEKALNFKQKVTSFVYERRWKNVLSRELTLDAYVVMYKAVTSGICTIDDFGYDSKNDLFLIIKQRVMRCINKECNKDIYSHVDEPIQDFKRILLRCINKWDINQKARFFTYFQSTVYNTSRDVACFRNAESKYSFCYDAYADSKGKAFLDTELVKQNGEDSKETIISLTPDMFDDYAITDCVTSVNSCAGLTDDERDVLLLIINDPTVIKRAETSGASSMDWDYLAEISGNSVLRLKHMLRKSILPKMYAEHLLPSLDTIVQVKANTVDIGSLDAFVASKVSLDTLFSAMCEIPVRNITCVA